MGGWVGGGNRERRRSSGKKTTKRAHRQAGQALLSFTVAALHAYRRASAVGRGRDTVERVSEGTEVKDELSAESRSNRGEQGQTDR